MVAWNLQMEVTVKPKKEEEDQRRRNRELCLSFPLELLLIPTDLQTLVYIPFVAPNALIHSPQYAMVKVATALHQNGYVLLYVGKSCDFDAPFN